MDRLAAHVVAQFILAQEEEAEAGESKGPPARWGEWMKSVQQGGKKRVRNPNPKTQKGHPEVSFNTALKNKDFFQRAMEDYREWAKKNPAQEKGNSPEGKKPESSKPPEKAAPEEKRATPPKPSKKPEPSKPKPPSTESSKPTTPNPPAKKPAAPKGEPKSDTNPVPPEKVKLETKPHQISSMKVTGKLEEAKKETDRLAKEHNVHFDKITNDIKGMVKNYEKKIAKDKVMKSFFSKLSDAEKIFHVGGHLVGHYFEKSLDPATKKQHDEFMRKWQGTSGLHDVQGAFHAMGVDGGPSPQDLEIDKEEKRRQRKSKGMFRRPTSDQLRRKGAKDKKVQDYMGKVYAFQQAYFKHIGLKEITMFRGVGGQIDGTPPKDGDEVVLKTREASSYTTDPRVAYDFGRVVQYKVPVDVWGSSAIRPSLGSDGLNLKGGEGVDKTFTEAELIILGSSQLAGKVLPKVQGMKTAAKKPFEVHLDDENEDWLKKKRKGKKNKLKGRNKKALVVEVLHRFQNR